MLLGILAMRKDTGFEDKKATGGFNNQPVSQEIKDKALAMLKEDSKACLAIGRELGVNHNSVRQWGQKAGLIPHQNTNRRRKLVVKMITENPYKYAKKDLCKALKAKPWLIARDLSKIEGVVTGDVRGKKNKYAIIKSEG